jgi:hypothetical protein
LSKRSSSSPAPLAIELRSSRALALWLVAVGALAALALLVSGAPIALKLALLAALGLYLTALLRRQRRPRCRGLRWDGERWRLIGADGRSAVLRLRRAVVWPLLLVLEFRGAGHTEFVLLLPDSAEPEQLRRLRVYLRHLPVYGTVAGRRSC